LFLVTSGAFAHDGAWGDENEPLDIGWIGGSSELELDHNDADPFKGWATLTVRNVCGEDWGDFHLKLRSFYGGDVNFVDTPPHQPQLWLKTGPSWQLYENLTWTITNGGDEMNLLFYDNPIGHGETAKIKVYTDNTKHHWSSFKIYAYPTPVPEPVTITLLALGGLALLRKRN
jgi:hypothetical protein